MADASGPVHVVLASASPRRLELLRRIGVDPEVRPADVDESVHPDEEAEDYVVRLAGEKAAAVAEAIGPDDDVLVVAADTTVVLGRDLLGKPVDAEAAAAMLRQLSGRAHRVLTGVAVRRGDRSAVAVETTEVHVRELSADEIDAYVATGEPMDKAGSYAIQGAGGMFVRRIAGSDSNVIGLPLATLVDLAREVDVTLLPR